MESQLLFEIKDGVAAITLNRPQQYNALSDQMRRELREAIQIINSNETIRVVTLTGAGKAFCAGGDIHLMKERIEQQITYTERLGTYRRDVADMVRLIRSIRQPLIAKINGAAFGAGCSLAMLCDFRVAADTVKFGLPFGKRGLIPDWGASYFLPRLIGLAKALELSATGRSFDAEEALQIGFVNQVVPKEELDAYVQQFCQEILLNGPISVTESKRLMEASLAMSLDASLEAESLLQARCYCTDDHREGVDCFIEQRSPVFTGQ
jgi:2-(1,2-epoxy-1,2-dihydrophenyl)acetyl-CoA isomerase